MSHASANAVQVGDTIQTNEVNTDSTHIDVAQIEEAQLGGAHIQDAHINFAANMLTDEQFTTLFSRILGNNASANTGATSIQPTNNTFTFTAPPFHFVQAVTPSDESLGDFFSFVSPSTILEITRFDFLPQDLYKLDPAAYSEAKGRVTKDFPTFASLIEPLCVYFQILGRYAATSNSVAAVLAVNDASLSYCAHLSFLSRTYEWHAVLNYHFEFFNRRSREMARGDFSGWCSPDRELICQFLFSRRISQIPSSKERLLFLSFMMFQGCIILAMHWF